MKLLNSLSVANKRVLVRCDFNVPSDKKGNILEDFKIKETIPTIKYLIEQKAKLILMSHLDPESTGVASPQYKMDNVAERLSEYLKMPIKKADDCIGTDIENQSNSLVPGEILLLENLKFYKEENEGDLEFAKKLSYLGDIYVNDAFGTCHRNYASIAGVPQFLPACMGLLLEKEINSLNKILISPEKPMISIIGGTKVGTKAKLIEKLSENSDFVIVSGLIKKEAIDKAVKFKYPDKIIGPDDNLAALDIDKKTIEMFKKKIMSAKTILWNGPFGKFEDSKYAKGTLAIAKAIIESKAFSVVGGGETVEFLNKQGIIQQFSHVSTGGGAMLQYLSGDEMPGLKALM